MASVLRRKAPDLVSLQLLGLALRTFFRRFLKWRSGERQLFGGDVQASRLRENPAAVEQQLSGYCFSTFCRLPDVNCLVCREVCIGQNPFEKIRVHSDHGQQVIQLVCAAAGEIGEGVQLLGSLLEHVLDRLAARQVLDLQQYGRVARIGGGNEPRAEPEYSVSTGLLVVDQLEMV